MASVRQTLDCQDCGEVVRELTPAEAQQVALHPENFIVLCRQCHRDDLRGSM